MLSVSSVVKAVTVPRETLNPKGGTLISARRGRVRLAGLDGAAFATGITGAAKVLIERQSSPPSSRPVQASYLLPAEKQVPRRAAARRTGSGGRSRRVRGMVPADGGGRVAMVGGYGTDTATNGPGLHPSQRLELLCPV